MSLTTHATRRLGRANHPSNPDRRHRASFARDADFATFGRHAWALDQADFEDRKPWLLPGRSPDSRFR